MDVDKHYRRKEYLLFPFLEKHEITGPPKVMWAKHDEARALLKKAIAALEAAASSPGDLRKLVQGELKPASDAVLDMIYKEEQILLPMSLDTLTEEEWYEVYRQSDEIGYCLYDPKVEWRPETLATGTQEERWRSGADASSSLPGAFTVSELTALLNTLPVDITFVDADDTVRYFSQGKHRIFDRNRAILGRQVQLAIPAQREHRRTHPEGFPLRSGGQRRLLDPDEQPLIHIEYFALRDGDGDTSALRGFAGPRRSAGWRANSACELQIADVEGEYGYQN